MVAADQRVASHCVGWPLVRQPMDRPPVCIRVLYPPSFHALPLLGLCVCVWKRGWFRPSAVPSLNLSLKPF